MRKFALLFIAIFTLLIYYAGLNEQFMRKIVSIPDANRPALLKSDKDRYGDLYGISYLPEFKKPIEYGKVMKPVCERPGNIHLYVIGDSFLHSRLTTPNADSLFCNTSQLTFVLFMRENPKKIRLNAGKTNIMIIEHTERFVRSTYNSEASLLQVMNSFIFSADSISQQKNKYISVQNKLALNPETDNPEGLIDGLVNFGKTPTGKKLFNSLINQNLERLLFDYSVFTPLKEIKAELNFRIFGRTATEVAVAENGQRLFFQNTVDSTLLTSSFKTLTDRELNVIVNNLNTVYNYFRNKGFDEVYFTIPPNSVSINEPERMGMSYNHLIERINEHPNLKMPVIDLYTPIGQHPNPGSLYHQSDTHWNIKGFQLWLDEVNKILDAY